MQKNLFFLLAVLFVTLNTSAGNVDTLFFQQQEEMLLQVHKNISSATPGNKKQFEIAFRDSLVKVLEYKNATDFIFDSLKVVGRVVSSDEKMIIYSWNIPQTGGFNNYYCIIKYLLKKEKRFSTIILEEVPGFLSQNQQAPATINNWPGVLYYKIITKKIKGESYYTVLGYDFNNLISNRKTIEVLKFDEYGYLSFVPKAFIFEGKKQNRIVFEYAERVQMTIEYNEKEKMIYFDHLSPFKPSLQGQYQFYGPDLSYDGLLFEEGVWIHKTDIQPEF